MAGNARTSAACHAAAGVRFCSMQGSPCAASTSNLPIGPHAGSCREPLMRIVLVDECFLHQELLRLETLRQCLPTQVERLLERNRHIQSHEPRGKHLGELDQLVVVGG